MSKICLMINDITELQINVDAYIVGLKNFNSLNVLELSIDELKKILNNKKIFVSMNKLIHNNEIDTLKDILIKLNELNIEGIIYDDISIYQIVKELNLNINLIWGNIHASTNYKTINEWYKLGVKSAIVSPDITLNEIIEIKNNTNSKILMFNYGMHDIFSSNRTLISNYLKYINKNKDKDVYYIKNKDTLYPVYEDSNGTHIINGNILNNIETIDICLENNIDYLIVNSYMLDNVNDVIDIYKEAIRLYEQQELDKNKITELSKKLNNPYRGFLDKEIIYKVKSDVNE